MLAKGLEPSTVRLQGGCSTIELHQQMERRFYNRLWIFSSRRRLILRWNRLNGALEEEGGGLARLLGILRRGENARLQRLGLGAFAAFFEFFA